MGNSHSPPKPIQPPDELHVFKGLDGVPMEYSIPEDLEKRKATDRFFTLLYIVLLTAWVTCSVCSMCYSDLKRITHGYDNCGNVCGEENSKIDDINCTGKDYREKKFLLFEDESALINLDALDTEPNECVHECDRKEYFIVMNRCFKRANQFDAAEVMAEQTLIIDAQLIKDLKDSSGYIVGMVFIALGLCFVTLLLFKYLLGFFVKALMVFTLIVLIANIYVISWSSSREYDTSAKIFSVVLFLVVAVGVMMSWKQLNFVIRIFKETTQAIFTIPLLMLIPIGIFLIEVVLTQIFIVLMMMFWTSGILTHMFGPYYTYAMTGFIAFTIVYTFIIFFFTCEYLNGCQQMIVAGAVSRWYFTRDKDNILGSPIKDSFRILVKYHLGSVAFGSLVITIMNIIRIIIKMMMRKRESVCFRPIINCCVDFMEEFVHYISNQSYIMIAMHGQPFIPSGKRATKLLIENALNTLSVNSYGDFVLFLVKVIITFLTILCGFFLDVGDIAFFNVTIFIGGVLAFLLANGMFRTFETSVDTIFLCYCEDTYIHDGIERPYYASPEMQALVDNAKGIVEEEKMYKSVKTQELPQSFV